ncbi:E3 ubiquitin protein ligase RIE1-like isoform X1 [Euphorbia lathyris]|uniref:E3 ubiquitin protein ligase RIE1-like isoform X1 n=1 Tax=Euphorbia lathyris TaxID=212925 RepID=UPI003313B097
MFLLSSSQNSTTSNPKSIFFFSTSSTLKLCNSPSVSHCPKMDQQAANRGGLGSTYSLLRHPTLTTALSLPHHTIFFGDCADPRLDALDDDTDAQTNNSSRRGYSKPVMVLDLIWNLAFVLVSVVVLFSATRERPSTPLRFWVLGYSLQCLFHVAFVYFQYRIRRRNDQDNDGLSSSQAQISIIKRLESINTLISSVWWVIGFYWIVVGGQALLQVSPRLYWLTVVFLAFNVLFILFCIGMACIMFIVVFCCIPVLAVAFAVAIRLTVVFLAFDVFFILFCIGMACIVFFVAFCCIPILAVAYAVAIRKGAREDDINSLPKYRYCHNNRLRLSDNDKKKLPLINLGPSNTDLATELPLRPEDSDCCICLSRYIDGVELYVLPCKHHFHCGCISKWLRINATCPLCKLNIRKGDTLA